MGAREVTREMLAAKFQAIFPHLDERQRRLLMGAEARALGHGGIRLVALAAQAREGTVSLGVSELESGAEPLGRTRRAGGGRKRVADLDRELVPALLALVWPQERGDPMSPLRWTVKSTRTLAAELTRQGHKVSADTVRDLLHEQGFSLQGNAKTIEGKQHPDRDAQFRYINEQARAHQDSGDPVISVDTKKKELVGQFKNGGREWRPQGQPVATRTHDFPEDSAGKAVPYGVYDITGNAGWVSVGTDHDTAAFAVESIRRWWKAAGGGDYPLARRLPRHGWHGDWNYTLRPEAYEHVSTVPDPSGQPSPDLAWLCHPALTGLPAQQWDALIAALMTLHNQQRETSLDARRGHRPRLTAPGTGRRPILTLADRLLAAILHQRLALPQVAVAALFSVRPETINKRIRDIRQLLEQAGYIIQPGPHRLASLADLSNLATAEGILAPTEIKTAC